MNTTQSGAEGRACARPGCENPLVHGKLYCSNKCAAQDRVRSKQVMTIMAGMPSDVRSLVPVTMQRSLVGMVGSDATPILEEMAIALQENKKIVAPPLLTQLTHSGIDENRYGTLFSSGKSYRDSDALSYDTIDDMLMNGQVNFALAVKSSAIRSVLRNSRSWTVVGRDERMNKVVAGIMSRVFARHSHEMMECIPYGSAFFEKVWDYLPFYDWGIEGARGKYYGIHKLKSMHPKSIVEIDYTSNGHTFDGFTQKGAGTKKIRVPTDLALILTYRKRFRNCWGRPAMEEVYPFWFWLEICWRSFLRYLERTGTPVTVVYAPGRGKIVGPDSVEYGTMQYALLQASYISKSNAAAFPSDIDPDTGQQLWRVEYLADDKRGDQFIRAISQLGTMVMRSLVIGDRAATQETGEPGSFASAKVHFEVTQLHNEMVLDELLSQINDYVVAPIVRFNGTVNSPRTEIETEGLDPDEKERLFTLLNTMGNQQGAEALRLVDWAKIMDVNNIPVLTKEEVDAAFEEKLERMKETQKVQQEGMPKPQGPPKKPSPTDQKVKQSADWLQYQAATSQAPAVLGPKEIVELAEAIREKQFYLYNPYHDKLGRFASKEGAHATVSGVIDYEGDVFDKLPPSVQEKVAAPAEFLSRKGALPAIVRSAIEVASDTFFNKVVGTFVATKGAFLGAAAIGAVSAALFGAAAPPALLAVGGVLIGTAAGLVAAEILDQVQTKFLHAYINRFSPKDDSHHHFIKRSGASKGFKVLNWIGKAMLVPHMVVNIVVFGNWDWEMLSEASIGAEEDAPDKAGTRIFINALVPLALTVIMPNEYDGITIPYREDLAKLPGFEKANDQYLLMDERGAIELLEAWATDDYPDIGDVTFGSMEVSYDGKSLGTVGEGAQMSDMSDALKLFNPHHDKLGRFTSKERSVTTSKEYQSWKSDFERRQSEDRDYAKAEVYVSERVGITPEESFFKKGVAKEEAERRFGKEIAPSLGAVGKFRVSWEVQEGARIDPESTDFYSEIQRLIDKSDYPDAVEYIKRDDGGHWAVSEAVRKLEGDEDSFSLYNPYHDELGRFTTAKGTTGFAPKLAKVVNANPGQGKIQLTDGETRTLKRNVNKVQSDLKGEVSGSVSLEVIATHSMKEFADSGKIPRAVAPVILGVAHAEGKMYLNPAVTESLAGRKKPNWVVSLFGVGKIPADDMRKLSVSTVSHETLHSRRRKYAIPYGADGASIDVRKFGLAAEEGTTELLNDVFLVRTGRMSRKDVFRLGAYKPYVYAMAREARARFPQSPERALGWLSRAHKTGFTIQGIKEVFGGEYAANGAANRNASNLMNIGGSWEDVEWVLDAAGSGVKLEEEPMMSDLASLLFAGKLEEAARVYVKEFTPDMIQVMSEFLVRASDADRKRLIDAFKENGLGIEDET